MSAPLTKYFLLFILFTFSGEAMLYGQTPKRVKTDSLQKLLRENTSLNETRVDRLNELGYEFWIVDPGQSIQYGNQALEIAKVLPYESGIAYANRIIGVAHWARGNLDLSFRYLIAARKAYQQLGDSLSVANSSLNLGMAYADQRNFDLAAQNYEEALSVFRRKGKDSRIATTYSKIADLLILQKKHAPAFDYLNQALVLHRQTGFLYGIAEANQKLGQLSSAQKEWDDAISYFLLAADAGKQRNDQVGLAANYLGIGKAYFAKKDLKLADSYLNRARQLAEKFGLQAVRRDVYLAFKELESRRGNYQKALQFTDLYLNVRDSLFNREKSNLIANMEARRAYEAQEEELVLAQKNLDIMVQQDKVSTLTKWLLILGLLTAITIAYAMLSRKNKVIASRGEDLHKANIRGDNLETALKSKEQELTSYTLNFVHKNEGITELKQLIQKLSKRVDTQHRTELKAIVRKLDGLLRVDEDWADFRRHFESVHPDLINRLGEEYPGLTSNEFRLIALIRLNLSTKEVSSVLGISPDSVKTARYRLRKKLNLNTGDNLFDFLLQYER